MVIGKARMATISGSGRTNSIIGVAISGKPNPNAPLTKQPRSTAINTARPSADKRLSMTIAAHSVVAAILKLPKIRTPCLPLQQEQA
jgi:hypothetical protein